MCLWTWSNSAPDLRLRMPLLLLASLLLSQDHTMSLGCWQFLGSWVPVYSYRLLWLHISSWDNLISKYHQVYSLWSDKSSLFFSFLFFSTIFVVNLLPAAMLLLCNCSRSGNSAADSANIVNQDLMVFSSVTTAKQLWLGIVFHHVSYLSLGSWAQKMQCTKTLQGAPRWP